MVAVVGTWVNRRAVSGAWHNEIFLSPYLHRLFSRPLSPTYVHLYLVSLRFRPLSRADLPRPNEGGDEPPPLPVPEHVEILAPLAYLVT